MPMGRNLLNVYQLLILHLIISFEYEYTNNGPLLPLNVVREVLQENVRNMSFFQTSPPLSPVIRMERKRVIPLSDYDIENETRPKTPITPSNREFSRSSTPKQKSMHIYISPIVAIIPRPPTPDSYISSLSSNSIHQRVVIDFEEDPNNILPPPGRTVVSKYFHCSSSPSSKEILTDYELRSPTSKSRRKRRNIIKDTRQLAKKRKLWFEQNSPQSSSSAVLIRKSTIDLVGPENEREDIRYTDKEITEDDRIILSPILNKRKSYDVISRGNINEDKSISPNNIFQIPEIAITRKTSSIQRRLSSDSSIRSVNSMSSMALSSMRSDDRELTEDDLQEINVPDSPISYVSSTTTLWDLPAKSQLSYAIPSPSDSTGSEDYSIVFERRHQKEIERKKQKKLEEEQRKVAEQQARRSAFKEFSIQGITWSCFSPDMISFLIKPKKLFPDHFSSKRKYSFSMKYNGTFWTIKTFRIPEYQTILKLYSKYEITDRNIECFLNFVVDVIYINIELEKEFKEERAAEFYSGKEMDLNDSDIELLLNEDQKRQYKEKCERHWKNMMSPTFP